MTPKCEQSRVAFLSRAIFSCTQHRKNLKPSQPENHSDYVAQLRDVSPREWFALRDGIAGHLLNRLQRLQNTGQRLITRTKKHDHIIAIWVTFTRRRLIKQRIEYNFLLLTIVKSSRPSDVILD